MKKPNRIECGYNRTLPVDGVMSNGCEIVGFRQVLIRRRNWKDSENEENEDEESESDE
jgi:hypothetical protein